MSGKVEICGVNTSKLPRYKDKEMQEMLAAVKAGDSKMRDKSSPCSQCHSEVFGKRREPR